LSPQPSTRLLSCALPEKGEDEGRHEEWRREGEIRQRGRGDPAVVQLGVGEGGEETRDWEN